jgi:hypothetical protein
MKPIDCFEKLIRDSNVLDINTSAEMDRRILHDTLKVQKECKRTKLAGTQPDIWRKIMKSSITKSAAVIAVVIGVGAIAVVGVNIGKYFYMGKDDGGHHFISTDGQSIVTMDDNDVTDVEQTRNDLQEMNLLSEQGKRELVRIIEIRANGRLERRLFVYKYQLPDGRTREMGDPAPENSGQWSLTDAQHKEAMQLKKAGPGEDLGTYTDEVMGRMFEFKRQQYVISDGTKVVWSVGEPADDQ